MMKNKHKFRPNPKAKLMDQVREVLRYHHYAYRTEVSIVNGLCGIFTIMEERPTHEKWGGNKLKPFYQTWLVKEMWRHPHSVRL